MEWTSLMLLVSLHVRNNRSSSVPTFGDTSRISDANLMSVIAVTVAVAHPNRLLLYQLKARTLTTPPLKEVTTPNEAEEVESTKWLPRRWPRTWPWPWWRKRTTRRKRTRSRWRKW